VQVGVELGQVPLPAEAGVARGQRALGRLLLLLGPELENEEVETAGKTAAPVARTSYGSHWEQRLFASELMAPVLVMVAGSPGIREALWRTWFAAFGFVVVVHHWWCGLLLLWAAGFV
jgi:hypothetical protein